MPPLIASYRVNIDINSILLAWVTHFFNPTVLFGGNLWVKPEQEIDNY